ncbi:PIR protein [Plasmodium vivax]|uniref:VIR protein n=1 Tax=Plasmodium vivax TaxID=5855 RepID=A0A564ZW52_PLAVI|nr:PIR protein [Plasmodium vivax]
MDLLACPESSSEKGACIEYYFELYNDVRVEFSNKTLEYVNTIKNYTHPFLKLVSLYLVENYYRAKEYFNTNGDNIHNVACHNLNRWLDQRKNFFTFSEKCNSSVTEWRIQVEELWKTIQHKFGDKHCNRVNKFSNTTVIPPEMLPATCYSSVPEEWLRNFQAQNQKLLNQKNCSNSENSSDKTVIPLLDLSGAVPLVKNSVECEPCPSTIPAVALTGSCTILGTLVLLFFLYKFTPLVSWMYNRRFKKRNRSNHNAEYVSYDTFARFPPNMDANFENRRSYISYHSRRH